MEIKLKKVHSTHIDSIGWENNVLRIKFNDKSIYDYEGVSKRTFNFFLNTKSKGLFFLKNIKPKYKVTKRD